VYIWLMSLSFLKIVVDLNIHVQASTISFLSWPRFDLFFVHYILLVNESVIL